MKRIFVAFAIAVVISGTAYARPEWTDPVKRMSLLCGFLDPYYIRTPCTSKCTRDERSTWRQHLGTDFSTAVGATVLAPVKGKVVLIDAAASKDPAKAFLVIKDARTGEEHVIGHISSKLNRGDPVEKGAVIGWVRDQGRATHVHWGFNLGSVESAMKRTTKCYRDGTTKDCDWGWGKAPYEATEREVRAQGWRNVL